MDIAYDAKRAFYNFSGLGNYSRSLIMAMMEHYPQHNYHLFTPAKTNSFPYFLEQIEKLGGNIYDNNTKYPDAFWRSFLVKNQINQSNPNIYHGLSAEIPLSIRKINSIRKVVTIHDLIFMRFPNLYKFIDRKIYLLKTKNAIEYSDVVIAISKQTKDDLIQYLNIPEEKIKIVYQNAHPIFTKRATENDKKIIKAKYTLPNDFILSVGTIEARKNGLQLLKAVSKHKDIPLVFVGGKTDYYKILKDYISEQKMTNRVFFLEKIPQNDLPILYQLARLSVYISSFEGFGIPIVEALHSGTPLIVGNNSSLMEIAGSQNNFVNPNDVVEIEEQINALWYSDELLEKYRLYNKEIAINFSEQKWANNTMEVYRSIL